MLCGGGGSGGSDGNGDRLVCVEGAVGVSFLGHFILLLCNPDWPGIHYVDLAGLELNR